MFTSTFTRSLSTLALAALLLPAATSCNKELNQTPNYLATADVVYSDPVQINQVLARLYATLSQSGQNGGNDRFDLQFTPADYSNYIRVYWKMQELTTDEAIIAWGDAGLPDFNTNRWNADNQFIRGMYEKIFFQATGCNDFLRETTDAKLAARGVKTTDQTLIKQYRAEARFLRALSYYHALDMFGNVPFVDETYVVGSGVLPSQISRADLFKFVESELLAIQGDLLAPKTAYGRADQGAAWTLLAKLYLNAAVYTGTARNTEAVTYANRVLASSSRYALAPNYRYLFMADNNTSSAKDEIIFPVVFDGQNTQGYGGTTFLVHASVGGAVPPLQAGINGGWFGMRARPTLVNQFPGGADSTSTDARALFFRKGQTLQISDPTNFNDGYASVKWRNTTSTGGFGSDAIQSGRAGTFVDTDFPLFRLADVKLMYAEALLRGGQGGTAGTALQQVNEVRARSGATALSSVTLPNILNERSRELYWEGQRRTDLIRFGVYATGYTWPFKGGPAAGTDIAATRTLFPLPNTDLVANPNLKQNPGY
ncbi:MAG: RagB/SusD family nutrient uptake outer membrane protein [Hymenobacter sp.]|nr:MAG: RagB/SusD family nutrient uptake outer membrane protein [Hymenobacter sp.]